MPKPYDTSLPPDLRALKEEIEHHARSYGLDFYETIFEVVDADDLNEIASYGGFPTRYPHWSFGMAYEELKKSYDYGLSKIYEMVINNDPCYAYLMRCNHTVDQKLVMAHVYGHCLAPETKIETEDSPKPIAEVKVGDRVLTHTGTFKRVRAVARRWFSGEIFCVRVEGSSEAVRITGEHPVGIAHGRESELKWIQTRGLRGGMLVAMPRAGQPIPDGVSVVQMSDGRWMEEEEPHTLYDAQYEWNAILTPKKEHYEGYVYNFSVEEDESYTLAAGFVVHNCDFFKNNAYFGHTSRKMMDEMANHGARVRRYAEKHGEDEVENFVDRCMSIDDLIDIHSVAIKRREEVSRYDFSPEPDGSDETRATRFKSKAYMDDYINPREVLKAEEEERKKLKEQTARNFPERPEKDVLLFLIEHAPLKGWQRDVLSIVRDEAYYFAPQAMTKVINEGWACTVAGSLVFTDAGVLTIDEIVNKRKEVRVSDGEVRRRIYDWARFADRKTVWLRTRRGLEIEGSTTHRLMLSNGRWRRLDELRVGDQVRLAGGADLWASDYLRLDWRPSKRLTLTAVAAQAGVDIETVIRYRRGVRGRHSARLAPLVARYEADLKLLGPVQDRRRKVTIPTVLDERLATFLGYLVGDGHISAVKRTLGLTTGDEEQADQFVWLVQDLFGVRAHKKWDDGRWRVNFSSRTVEDFLKHLGLKTGRCAREKNVPDGILRSPKSVVAAFLRGLYDADGYAGGQGVILSTSSVAMSKTVQLLLLNFGILSSRRLQKDGCWHVEVFGKSAARFQEEISFGLQRKRKKLAKYLQDHRWFLNQEWIDDVVAVERRRADVFDISVEETHCYAAQGFINHNSYWHSTIMTERALEPWECVDYADHHSGTMATYGARINPYKLGIELLRHVEHRWDTGKFGKDYDDCDDLQKRRTWDKKLGLGRKKIFEVRRVHNDITFIDTFLTPEFCVEHKLFSYAFQEQAGQYFIESRDFQKIKQRLLFSLTNFGKPWIYVVDGNYRNRGELLLRHEHNGVDLKLNQAADTLANLQFMWSRPVHLQTTVDGKPTMLSFDGSEHSIRSGGESDDGKRSSSAKTK